MNLEDRPVQFRTIMYLYILLGVGVGLTIHFILLSTVQYNWL
ncbi:light-harvesting protein [bacterium]|nr:light-harvesting protein [bacterium]